MSFYAMAWALRQTGLRCSQKLLLVALADAHNEQTGLCIPSLDVLAEQCCVDRSTVIRNLNDMVEAGLIEKHERRTAEGRQTSNAYVLIDYLLDHGRGGTTPPSGVAPCDPNLEEQPKVARTSYERAAPRRVHKPMRHGVSGRGVVRRPEEETPDVEESPALGADPDRAAAPQPVTRRPPPASAIPKRRDSSRLTAYAENPQTPYHVAARFKEKSIQGKRIDPANMREFSSTLKRWYADGVDIDLMVAMVDAYAARPESYGPKADIPWRAFINAREKLREDALKVVKAENPSSRFGGGMRELARSVRAGGR